MPRTPAQTDDDLAVPIAVGLPEPTPSGPRQVFKPPREDHARHGWVHEDGLRLSIEADIRLLSRELGAREAHADGHDTGDAEAKRQGRASRAALLCARALLVDPFGTDARAAEDWRAAFRLDPSSWAACWGLRRQLVNARSFDEWLAVLDLELGLAGRSDGRQARSELLAALWLDRGRLLEDVFERAHQAAESYRAGLIDHPAHSGLRLALLWLALQEGDVALLGEAITGFLRTWLPAPNRVALTVLLARAQRVDAGVDASAAQESLWAAWRAVGPEAGRPLLLELARSACDQPDGAARIRSWGELAAALSGVDDALAAALFRCASRLSGDQPGTESGVARELLMRAWELAPRHPLILGELAEVIEGAAGPSPSARAEALSELMVRVIGGAGAGDPADDRALDQALGEAAEPRTEAEVDLVLRWLAAQLRAHRVHIAAAYLDGHPGLGGSGHPREFAVELAVRLRAGDRAGMATAFHRLAQAWSARRSASAPIAEAEGPARALEAFALVTAALLSAPGLGRDSAADSERGEPDPAAEALFRSALAVAPTYAPAWEGLLGGLRREQRWSALAEALASRLDASTGSPADDRAASRRLGEELIVILRDRLDDPERACRHQDALASRHPSGLRDAVCRWDLELLLEARGRSSAAAVRLGLLRALAAHVGGGPSLQSSLQSSLASEAGRLALQGGAIEAARELFHAALAQDPENAVAADGLEGLAAGPAARAEVVREELARLRVGVESLDDAAFGSSAARARALRFRLAWHCELDGQHRAAVAALSPLVEGGDDLARSVSWDIARRSNDPALASSALSGAALGPLELACDRGEALEEAGDLAGAERAFREGLHRSGSAEGALGLLRVGAISGQAEVVLDGLDALRAWLPDAASPLRRRLERERALLSAVRRTGKRAAAGAAPGAAASRPRVDDATSKPEEAVLRWLEGSRSGEPHQAASGLLALAATLPAASVADRSGASGADRAGLLARAALRSRLAGIDAAVAVHDRVLATAGVPGGDAGAAAAADMWWTSVADLPIDGKTERIAAREARAARSGGSLAYALDLECALDAEARGAARGALDAFARALRRCPNGIEAIEGIRRVATAAGDRRGAARACMRLGAILRTPARAAAAFMEAGVLWEGLGSWDEACVAYWHALARDSASGPLQDRLRRLLIERSDVVGLDRLFGIRLHAATSRRARLALLLARGRHRLERLADRSGAIQDFKRILKIEPRHAPALQHLASLATQLGDFAAAARGWERLLALPNSPSARAELCVKLADAHASAGAPMKAIAVLRASTLESPHDSIAWRRITELLLQGEDWRGALEALVGWSAHLTDPVEQSRLWVRRGLLHRDYGQDDVAAVAAFRAAAELDPLGDGVLELVGAYERMGAAAELHEALARAISTLRRELGDSPVGDPFDVARLRLLRALLGFAQRSASERPARAFARAAFDVVGAVLELLGATAATATERGEGLAGPTVGEPAAHATGQRDSAPALGDWVVAAVAAWPAEVAMAAHLWTHSAATVARMLASVFPGPARTLVDASADPARSPVADWADWLRWIGEVAVALGMAAPRISVQRGQALAGAREAAPENENENENDEEDRKPVKVAVNGAEPELVLRGKAPAALDPATRFELGRLLGLLHAHAALLEHLGALEVSIILAAVATMVGLPAPHAAGTAVHGVELDARTLNKAMPRRERKALERAVEDARQDLGGAGLDGGVFDGGGFREAVVALADQIGLLLCSDVVIAARAVTAAELGRASGPGAYPGAREIRASERAAKLVRFALSDAYLRTASERHGYDEPSPTSPREDGGIIG